LSELLGADEPLFSVALQQLERASGQQSVDVRLSAEIIGKVHQKLRELGLDPRDTTPEELYTALLELIKKHDEFLARRIGVDDPTDVQEALARSKIFVEHLKIPKTGWFIKASAAKRLVKASPPRKVMKQLGYRSVDSMLKREHIGEIFAAIRFAETPDWQSAFMRKYKSLAPRDFEVRDIEFHLLDPKRWGSITDAYVRGRRRNVTHSKELGVILVLPLPVKRLPGITITILPLLLHYVNEIRLYSSFFKHSQMKPDFSQILIDTLQDDPGKHAKLAGHDVHWRVIHRYFGQASHKQHPEVFEPHVQPEDLAWRKAEEVLYRIEPALHFWHDMDYVALKNGFLPVSFNLMDMAVNYVNQLPYGKQVSYHFRDALWNELLTRYMGQPAFEHQILKQLDHGVVTPETSAFSFQEIY